MLYPEQEYKITWIIPLVYTTLAFIIALIILQYPLPILNAEHFTEDFWYTVVFKITGFLIVPSFLLYRAGYSLDDVFYRFKVSKRSLITIPLVFFMGLSINLIGRQRTKIATVLNQTTPTKAISLFLVAVILAYLVAGIPEELLFRWFAMSRLETKHHWVVSLLLSSLFFTMWHLPTRFLLANGSEGVAGDVGSVFINTALPVFITSCVLGIFWHFKRSLPHLMIAHGAIDIIPIYASLLGIQV